MAKRKETPNIMEELGETPDVMGDVLEGKKPAEQPPDPSTSTESQSHTSTVSYSLKRYVDGDKIKGSYYLSSEILERLDESWIEMRRMVGKLESEQRGRVTKSLLVEATLQLVLEELERDGLDSRLAKKLTSFW